MCFHHWGWHITNNRHLFRIPTIFLVNNFFFLLLLFRQTYFNRRLRLVFNFMFQNLILLLLSNYDMTLRFVSNVKTFNFILLALLDIFKCKKTLLTDQTYLFVCPYFHRVITFFLNFIL